MPNETFRVKLISRKPKTKAQIARGKGQSAVACAAYRSGEKLRDKRLDKIFDYTRKEKILHTEIMTPKGAPGWARDREKLWNKVEFSERRSNARLSREILAALPRELSDEQNIALVREFVQTECVDKGMIADIALHNKLASDGGKNPHVHIMLTLRDIDNNHLSKHRNREWDKTSLLKNWRERWETLTNTHLDEAGSSERLSLQSYAARGINKQPGIHLGPHAWALEQKGTRTKPGQHNFKVNHFNQVRQVVDASGLGLHDDTMLANMLNSLSRDQQSNLVYQHHDQPLEPHQRQHIADTRKAIKGINFKQFKDPRKLVKYLQEYRAREEVLKQQAANDNLAEKGQETELEKFWSGFLESYDKDSDLGGQDDGRGR